MGFVGNSPRGQALWTEIARLTNFDLSRLEGNVLFNTLLSIIREEEGDASQAAAVLSPGPDIAQIRDELQAQMPVEWVVTSSAPAYASAPKLAKADVPTLV